ncbi:hypothetical protein [Enterobacter quasiroggenkampii]|uniref:hypothetical protein n=1 Tax=Enterobacter TaxID=547 RepID=UPI0021D0ED0E|nr:hypothetical protein [Enterobacter quasiroggenkampii]MCU6387907.1 hypothetical protein [Enterobacter quasiroggenkampii]
MIFEMYLHKIEHFTNARAEIESFGNYVYVQDEPDLFPICFKKENGKHAELSRWQTCFPKVMLQRTLKKLDLSEDETYTFEVFLSRLGYLFQIDNRQRIDKDIFILFYMYQLFSLKNNKEDYVIKAKSFFLRFLCFEMGMDDESYNLLCITNDGLCINTLRHGKVSVLSLLEQFYAQFEKQKNFEDLKYIKLYQTSVLSFLFVADDGNNRLFFNDKNCYLIEPDNFIKTYKKSKKIIYRALEQCFDKYQSTKNLLISNFILMNYSYYIVRNNLSDLKNLRRHVPSDMFRQIISSIAYRGFFVDEEEIFKLFSHEYKISLENEGRMLFNLIYSI